MRLILASLVGCGGGTVDVLGEVPPDAPATPPPSPVFPPVPPTPVCDAPAELAEGAFLDRDSPVSVGLPACSVGTWAFAGAEGSRVALTWSGPPVTLQITDLDGAVLATSAVVDGGSIGLTLGWTGEHLVRVRAADDLALAGALTASCEAGCDLPYTRYPIVFLHGMAGTESFLDGLDYWYGVREVLEPLGYVVHFGAVDPFQTSEVRAAQWALQIDGHTSGGRARRVNLIGHSQGGIDARELAARHDPDGRIASITTISTPHHGTAVADLATGVLSGVPLTPELADAVFDGLGDLYGTSDSQHIVAQLDQLSTPSMEAFNLATPDRPDVPIWSWAGRTCQLLDFGCQQGNGDEVVSALFTATHLVIQLAEGDNDGLVSVQSATWGTFLGELPADHLDEVGLFPGTTAPGWDHLGFFVSEAERLAAEGL